jgi:hypothetical protein
MWIDANGKRVLDEWLSPGQDEVKMVILKGIEVKDGKLLLEFKGTNLGAGDQNPVVSGMEIIRVG